MLLIHFPSLIHLPPYSRSSSKKIALTIASTIQITFLSQSNQGPSHLPHPTHLLSFLSQQPRFFLLSYTDSLLVPETPIYRPVCLQHAAYAAECSSFQNLDEKVLLYPKYSPCDTILDTFRIGHFLSCSPRTFYFCPSYCFLMYLILQLNAYILATQK